MRMHGHGAHDDMSYVPPEMFEEWAARDPIDRYRERLTSTHGFSTEEVEALVSDVRSYVEECAANALESPMPDPERALDGVYADEWEALGDGQAPWSRWTSGDSANGATERRAA
jgi:TPP-dependent pyruvate/acetoin dehydrogenase alpha subunit